MSDVVANSERSPRNGHWLRAVTDDVHSTTVRCPRCFGPRTASGSCCGDGGPSLVRVSGLRGAYRPSNEHEDGRPVALKTDLAYTKMDQPLRQTNERTTSKVIL